MTRVLLACLTILLMAPGCEDDCAPWPADAAPPEDSAATDSATPDAPAPDAASPDSAAPDSVVPDLLVPDTLAPDASRCGFGATDCGGTCANLQSDNAHCGKCGTACAAGKACQKGVCVLSCQAGLTDCGGTCVNLQTDLAHCGKCANVCKAGQVCSAGACALSCQAGLTACGGTCVNLQTDLANCGACTNACAAGQVCAAGKCVLSCQAGLTDCSGTCVNLQADNAHCGSCASPCLAGQLCSAGKCALSCQAGLTQCGGTCVDTKTSSAHCGKCNSTCSAAKALCCGSACVNPATDVNNCGACGTACKAGQICAAGVCGTASCGDTQANAGKSCLDLLQRGCSKTSGTFWVDPDGGSTANAFQAHCDMTTSGGGWTGVTLTAAHVNLGGAIKVVQGSATTGVDSSHRPHTRDGSGSHSAWYTFQFAPGFTQFYFKGLQARANAGSGHKSDMNLKYFKQTTWSSANGSTYGDISHGSAGDPGPTTSFARYQTSDLQCTSCTLTWPKNLTIYAVAKKGTAFRMSCGEGGGEAEGWYLWWAGVIYLR